MIVSALSLAMITVLVVAFAGGSLLRITGRLAVIVGLLDAFACGDPLGLLIATIGATLVATGSSRPLDRRRPHG